MKTLYLDLVSGISGDMFIGAMLDLGVDPLALKQELSKLGLGGYHVHVARAYKSSIAGTKFDVHIEHDHEHHHEHDHDRHEEHEHSHGHAHSHSHTHPDSHVHPHSHSHDEERTFAQIKELILRSALSDWVKARSVAIFHRIAVAEGKIHGLPPEEVHFHEVGAIDSIVDIVGACVALELMDKPRVLASRVVEGNGWVDCAHGRFPIPAPATLAILGARGIALTQCNEPQELVT
ncbi:MAG: LarC family nickel insertion protein, partial [Limisphaerales bacterium]